MLVRKSLPNDGAAGAGVIDRVPAGDGSAGVVSVGVVSVNPNSMAPVSMAAGAISAAFGATGEAGATVVTGAASASDIDGA